MSQLATTSPADDPIITPLVELIRERDQLRSDRAALRSLLADVLAALDGEPGNGVTRDRARAALETYALGGKPASNMLHTRLKQLMEASGHYQAEMARLTGIPDSTICRVNNGQCDPSASTVLRYLQGLGLSWSALEGVDLVDIPPPIQKGARTG